MAEQAKPGGVIGDNCTAARWIAFSAGQRSWNGVAHDGVMHEIGARWCRRKEQRKHRRRFSQKFQT
jgi:hypothetical protein